MSEMISEISVDMLRKLAPEYPADRVQFMFDKFPDKDLFIECKGCVPYLLVRLPNSRYSFFGPHKDSVWYPDNPASEGDWNRYMTRSYKIIRDTGALPYAHRF